MYIIQYDKYMYVIHVHVPAVNDFGIQFFPIKACKCTQPTVHSY